MVGNLEEGNGQVEVPRVQSPCRAISHLCLNVQQGTEINSSSCAY